MSDGLDETRAYEAPPASERVADAPPTAELPVADTGWDASRIAMLFIAVAAAAFLIGIAVATATRPVLREDIVGQGTVGPSGGTVRFDGGEIRVPAGALTHEIEIVVHRSSYDDEVKVTTDHPVVFQPGTLSAYRFDPEDVTFQRPVEVLFRLPDEATNGTPFARRGKSIVLLSGRVDPNRRTTMTEVNDFRFEDIRR